MRMTTGPRDTGRRRASSGRDRDATPTFWQVIKSVAASFFGVQNRANRVRDFTHGRPMHFIVIGLAMTVVFVLVLVGVVKLVLWQAGI